VNELHVAARSFGARAVPLVPRGKRPAVSDWPNWPATPEAIDTWWRRHPDANVGVRTGRGLVVLDVDPRAGGDGELQRVEHEYGALPATLEVVTGGEGRHLYFRGPRDLSSYDLAPGLEVKARGRQVVAPPSVHPSGRLYVWHPARSPETTPQALVPVWIAALAPGRGEAVSAPSEVTAERRQRDPLLAIPAAIYVEKLTGRRPNRRGYVTCPFHRNGQERTPSLKVDGALWSCFGCSPIRPGRECAGGDMFDLAALLGGYPVPLAGRDYRTIRGVLERHLARAAA